MEISNLTKKRIKKYLKEDKRFDGRGLLDFREIKIETGISKNAEGSAKVKLGKTEVIVGIKVDVAEPYPDSEDKGTLKTTVELLPLSSSEYEPGPPRIKAIEIARVIDRIVREGGFIDFKKLCIKEGEKVYNVYIDIYTLNDEGNLLDAGAIAAVTALLDSKMPKYNEKEEKIEYGEHTDEGLPLTKSIPVLLTSYKIGEKIIFDPTREEEKASEGRLSVGIAGGKELTINALQKGESLPLEIEEISKITKASVKKYKEIEKKIKKSLK